MRAESMLVSIALAIVAGLMTYYLMPYMLDYLISPLVVIVFGVGGVLLISLGVALALPGRSPDLPERPLMGALLIVLGSLCVTISLTVLLALAR